MPGHPVPAPDALGAVLITGGVGALSLGLVKGGAWGWGSAATIGVLALSAVALAGCSRCTTSRHPNPLIDRSLFRLRPFTGASIVALLFSAAFGAMLLSRRAVGPGRLALVGADHRPVDRARADHGAAVLVPGRRAG